MNKTYVYYLSLTGLFGIGVFQILNFDISQKHGFWSLIYSLWAVMVLAVVVWSKKEITGTAWFPKKHKKLNNSKSKEVVLNIEDRIGRLPDLTSTEKEAYIELTKLCCSITNQQELIPFFKTLKNFEGDDEYLTTLNFVMEALYKKGINFIIGLDWKTDGENVEGWVKMVLSDNFDGLSIQFPDYDKTKSAESIGLFQVINELLVEHNLVSGFIDTMSDEYIMIIHKIVDQKKVEALVNQIGYKYGFS